MGPLQGIKIVELAGIGPGPMAAMLLADLGATVLRIERRESVELGVKRPLQFDLLLRNRQVIALNLKQPEDHALALRLIGNADGLIEGTFGQALPSEWGSGPTRASSAIRVSSTDASPAGAKPVRSRRPPGTI